jgi:hypothetical protein
MKTPASLGAIDAHPQCTRELSEMQSENVRDSLFLQFSIIKCAELFSMSVLRNKMKVTLSAPPLVIFIETLAFFCYF